MKAESFYWSILGFWLDISSLTKQDVGLNNWFHVIIIKNQTDSINKSDLLKYSLVYPPPHIPGGMWREAGFTLKQTTWKTERGKEGQTMTSSLPVVTICMGCIKGCTNGICVRFWKDRSEEQHARLLTSDHAVHPSDKQPLSLLP